MSSWVQQLFHVQRHHFTALCLIIQPLQSFFSILLYVFWALEEVIQVTYLEWASNSHLISALWPVTTLCKQSRLCPLSKTADVIMSQVCPPQGVEELIFSSGFQELNSSIRVFVADSFTLLVHHFYQPMLKVPSIDSFLWRIPQTHRKAIGYLHLYATIELMGTSCLACWFYNL